MHPHLNELLDINRDHDLKTTIYTNGYFLDKYSTKDFKGIKLRVSLYCKTGATKSLDNLPKTSMPIDICFMVSRTTTIEELVECANDIDQK